MAQDIKKGYMRKGSGELDRTFPRIFKYDAGPNVGTLRSKEELKNKIKKKIKKKARSGNIGNVDMSDFTGSSAILGKDTDIGKKMSSSRNKYKVKNEKEDGMLASLYKSFSRKSSSYDPTKSNFGGQRLGQRKAGGMMNSYNKGGLPDFSGDGKITEKDVLMGRGVIPKPKKASKGTMMQARGCGVARKKQTKIT